MRKFPVDAPKERVVEALEILGFQIVREKELGQSWANTLNTKLWQAAIKSPKPEQSDVLYPSSKLCFFRTIRVFSSKARWLTTNFLRAMI